MDTEKLFQKNFIMVKFTKSNFNPVSVSDFSILGDKWDIRFESNIWIECGKEPKWNDCTNVHRERTELYYKKKPWKKERWYMNFIILFANPRL